MGNGITERFNRTLLNMLGTLEPDKKTDWKSYIAPLVHAYNATRHDTTGESPFFLMFGRQPRLPIDLCLGLPGVDEGKENYLKYVAELRKRLQEAYHLATATTEEAQKRQKGNYDTRTRGVVVKPGDRVLVRKLAFEGRHKIADRFEEGVYIILEQPNGELPVYVVQREGGGGRKRTLHRNHLLPVSSLPIEETPDERPDNPRPVPKPRDRTAPKQQEMVKELNSTFEDTDSESDDIIVVTQRRGTRNEPEVEDENGAEPEVEDMDEELEVEDMDGENTTEEEETELEEAEEEAEEEIEGIDTSSLGSQSEGSCGSDRESPQNKVSAHTSPVPPQPAQRRSLRDRKPPDRYSSCGWIMKQQQIGEERQQRPRWMEKVEVLTSLTSNPAFSGMSNNIYQAIIDVVATT